MTTPAPTRRPGIGLDLALNILLAGVAFWAGMEWLRAAYEEAMTELRADFEDIARTVARDTSAAAAQPVAPKMAAGSGKTPLVKRSQTKVPQQSDGSTTP